MKDRNISTACDECRYHYAFWDNDGHECYCIFENNNVDGIHITNCLDSVMANKELSGCKYFVNFVMFMKNEGGNCNEINV